MRPARRRRRCPRVLWRRPAAARMRDPGEVSEWLKEHAWKVCKRLNRASGVRIPLSPPDSRFRFPPGTEKPGPRDARPASMVAPSAPRDARSKIPPGPEGSNGIDRRGRRGQPAGPPPFRPWHAVACRKPRRMQVAPATEGLSRFAMFHHERAASLPAEAQPANGTARGAVGSASNTHSPGSATRWPRARNAWPSAALA